ncbi:hypothetical protein QQF64_022027 [Cirrhinus molitorella]|uniref:Secreted protein n=1 Tax=Cirrhinus molitorella TaxID=172907 RepID=A0ABR3LAH9_9TELE
MTNVVFKADATEKSPALILWFMLQVFQVGVGDGHAFETLSTENVRPKRSMSEALCGRICSDGISFGTNLENNQQNR